MATNSPRPSWPQLPVPGCFPFSIFAMVIFAAARTFTLIELSSCASQQVTLTLC